MKTRANEAIRELRKNIGRTQGEFAAMIGASKDAVASWEIGRNRLSPTFARRIAFATGVEAEGLLRGRRGHLTYSEPFAGHRPYTAAAFEHYRKSYWGRSDDGAARQHLRHCADALGLLLLAAARPGGGKVRHRLPGVLDSFIQWCERTREEFKLDPQIQEQLEQRKEKLEVRHPYGEWRRMQKEDPGACRMMGFKDDPRKTDQEELRLEVETVPLWRPGHSMRAPREQGGGNREQSPGVRSQ